MLNPDDLFTLEAATAAVARSPLPRWAPDLAGRTLRIPQDVLLELANRWEPDASASEPTFRPATCVQCGQEMTSMWHVWLSEGGFKKECHLCWACGLPWLS